MIRLKEFFSKHKKIIFSFILFCLIFLLLGIPYTNWALGVDGPGLIWHSKINNFKDFLRFFTDPGMTTLYNSSNYIIPKQSFFTVRYVPFYYVFLSLQNLLFGFSFYGYYLVTILLHAINSILLFHIFSLFVGYSLGFIGAVYFAFHPSLCTWLGWIATQYYQLELLLFLLILIFIKKYLDVKNLFFYFLSCFLYLLCLFTRETLVIFPIWLFLSIYFYLFFEKKIGNNILERILFSLKVSLGFWIVWIFYILVRLYSYPLNLGSWSEPEIIRINPIQIFLSFKYRFFELVTLITNLANQSLYFLPPGNQLIKGFLIIVFFLPLAFLFIKNKKKSYILFLFFSILFFLWPAFLKLYVARYLYLVLPFYILILLLLIQFSDLKCRVLNFKIKKLGFVIFSLLILINIFFLISALSFKEQFLCKKNKVLEELVKDKRINDKPLCFLGIPYSKFYTGLAQYMRILGFDKSLSIYYDNRVWVGNCEKLKKNYLVIKKIKNKFRLISKNPEKLWFIAMGENCLGNFVINKIKKEKPFDVSLTIDKKYLLESPIFISWDYEHSKFIILDKNL